MAANEESKGRVTIVSREAHPLLLGILRRQGIIKGDAMVVTAVHENENENPGY